MSSDIDFAEGAWPDESRDSAIDSFVAHLEVAQMLAKMVSAGSSVIEFGCGGGLLGEQLAQLGFSEITGLEQSAALRSIADAKNCYRSIRPHNLTQPLRDDVRYNAGACVGMFGSGPVGATHISYMTSVLDEDAPLFITVNGQSWLEQDWPSELEAAQQADGFTIEYVNTIAYLDESKLDGRLIIIRNSDTRNEK